MIRLSIIIVNYNTPELVSDCINSIVEKTKGIDYEIIVVDNSPKDNRKSLSHLLEKVGALKIVRSLENRGFGAANNIGLTKAEGKYVLFLNSDTLLTNNILPEMVAWMENEDEAGVVSCGLRNVDGSVQGTGGRFPDLFRVFCWMFFLEDLPILDKLIDPFHPMHARSPFYKGSSLFAKARQRDWVTGAFLLTRKSILGELGGFDEDYFMYVEEVDLCWRVKKKGWKIWYLPKWNIVHLGGKSSSSEFAITSEYKGLQIFYRKHKNDLELSLMKLFLRAGAILRMFIYGIIQGREGMKIYAKAFQTV